MAFKVLVIGIDGVRYDTLQQVRTPNIDAIAAAGFCRPVQVDDAAPTISGPGWATIASGVLASKHRIYDNNLAGNALSDYPDFLTRLRGLGVPTYAAAAWKPLLGKDSGGPIFAGGGFQPTLNGTDGDAWLRADAAVADHAAQALPGDIRAAFVYLGAPDEVAHHSGTDAEYVAAIEAADAMTGRIVDRLTGEWAVIVVTDHGHVDGGGHGGDTPAERTAWIAACGPTIPTTAPDRLAQTDVHPQLMRTLDVPLDPGWHLDGTPFG